jgi:hypothetical protein
MKETITVFLIFFLFFGVWFLVGCISFCGDSYEESCRKAGGVPVYYRGSENCATSGYIDIKG